ncbi:MAG: dihydroorotate dehydrogenase-like protein [Candidatus Cloacimonadota bacterium]|nr:MAG: dihydroorotate dehydrogenase-like protein [Candidatus Cloacimonadota bacterium]
MSILSTEYMGLKLKNPLLVASCSLTKKRDGVEKCAEAGAGAIVLKSLFEEQIDFEIKDMEKHLMPYWHPEALDYVQQMGMSFGPNEYLKLIEETKKTVSVPVIASLNCISPKWWITYAKQIVEAGADALELNIAIMPSDPNRTGTEIEDIYVKIVNEIKPHISIPFAVKIGPYFSSLAHLANRLSREGAAALVLFNRFYQPNINTENLTLAPGYNFSSPEDMGLSLRWIALLSGSIGCDLAASTGIHDGEGVIKQLLAGATVAQLCSTLYLNGLQQIGKIIDEVSMWMENKGFQSIKEFHGKLSQSESDKPELYERVQYIKALVGIE